MANLVAEGVEATVTVTVPETVNVAERLIRTSDEGWTTNKAIAEELNVDKSAASRRVSMAINRGYLKNLEETAQLVTREEKPEDREILPTPEDLQGSGCAVEREFGGVPRPLPPTGGDTEPGTASP